MGAEGEGHCLKEEPSSRVQGCLLSYHCALSGFLMVPSHSLATSAGVWWDGADHVMPTCISTVGEMIAKPVCSPPCALERSRFQYRESQKDVGQADGLTAQGTFKKAQIDQVVCPEIHHRL